MLFLPSVHFLLSVPVIPILLSASADQFLLQSFASLSPTDLAAFPVSLSLPLGSFPAGSSDHPIRVPVQPTLLCYKIIPPISSRDFPLSPIAPQIFPECTPPTFSRYTAQGTLSSSPLFRVLTINTACGLRHQSRTLQM